MKKFLHFLFFFALSSFGFTQTSFDNRLSINEVEGDILKTTDWQLLPDSSHAFDTDINLNWNLTGRSKYLRDGQGKLIEFQVFTLNTLSGLWEYSQRYIYNYNLNGQVEQRIQFSWDNALNTWQPKNQYIYTYNTLNQLESRSRKVWANQSWVNLQMINYFYNTQTLLQERVFQAWNDTTLTWINNFKDVYSYNASDQVVEIQGFGWAGTAWQINDKTDYTYTNNFLTQTITSIWDINTNIWVLSSKNDYENDVNGTILLSTWAIFDGVQWLNQWQDEYVYVNGFLEDFIQKNWDEITLNWVNSRKTHYFNSPYFVEIESHLSLSFSIYPTITQQKLTLTFANRNQEPIQIMIVDATGKTVEEMQVQAAKMHQIDVSKLPNGIYWLQAKGDNSYFQTQKFIKQ